jgi:acyl-CoA synthetase (AMP-forming)/AMP-acid ligase II
MLFERWGEISRARADHLAVRDLSTGSDWMFRQLADAAAAGARSPATRSLFFPQGHSVEFIVDVLRAWRSESVVCPLEPAQTPPQVPAPPSRIIHLKTTSASTGLPRLVAFTAAQLMADAENIVATMGLRPDWPNLGIISLSHSYGFSNLVLPLLLHGIPLVLVPSTLPEALRRAVAGFDALTLSGVPALWRAWHEASAIPPNVRLAVSAGAPLPLSLEKEVFERTGLKLHNFYGSSECGGIAYDSTETPRSDPACIGQGMTNVDLSIAEDGCLEVRGAAVGETCWPEAAPNLSQGLFRTSDLAEIQNGIVYFRGRACDRINVAGRKVSPEAIEMVLSRHPAVRECLVFGAPSDDPSRGETVVACLATSSHITPDAIRQHAMASLPSWQLPREWWFVESLGVNGRGKISRSEMREKFLTRKL